MYIIIYTLYILLHVFKINKRTEKDRTQQQI